MPTNEVRTGYIARQQFIPLHRRDKRWAIVVAHRRAGKTVACINDLIDAALRCEKENPRFAYVAPFYSQAKDVAWNYLKQYTASIPGAESNESELRVDLPGGRRIRLYGADNYERLRGLYFDGIVLDEYGDMDPQAWQAVIRASLADRQGWAVFIGTPKGRNHFAEQWEKARNDDKWFSLSLRASETDLLPESELADARKEMTEEQYAAEFECSFDALVIGAYYAREMRAAEKEGRVCDLPYQPEYPVHTAWDLGLKDSTAIWFVQVVGQYHHCIDYLENSGVGLDWYARELQSKPYTYGECIWPHDGNDGEWGSGKTRVETAHSLRLRPRVLERRHKTDSINGARLLLARCRFDRKKCARGLDALRNYRREWDDKRKVFHDRPLHDWCSHGADAFAELAAADLKNDLGWAKPLNYGHMEKGIV